MSTKWKVRILTITENKLDSFFTTTEFLIDVFSKPFKFEKEAKRWWCSYVYELNYVTKFKQSKTASFFNIPSSNSV